MHTQWHVAQHIVQWTGWSRDFSGGIWPIAKPQPVNSFFALRGLDDGLISQFAKAPNLLSRAGQQYTRGYASTQCALPIRSEMKASQSGMRVVNPVVVFSKE